MPHHGDTEMLKQLRASVSPWLSARKIQIFLHHTPVHSGKITQ